HNEGDDPSMTQPLMYRLIENKRSVRKLYSEALIGRGDITVEEAEAALRDYQQQLERVFTETREATKGGGGPAGGLEKPEAQREGAKPVLPRETAISQDMLTHIGKTFSEVPQGFEVHPKLSQLLAKRTQMTTDGDIDWAMGELLAFGSLLMEQTPVR